MTSTSTDRRDGFNTSAAIKVACRCATTANVTLSGYQTIDGILPTSSDSVNRRRVFVKSQTTASENGIYIMDTGTWARANDFDSNRDLVQGTLIPVNEGTTLGGSVWRVTNTGTITIGTTSLTFERAYVSNSDSQTFLQSGTGAVSRTVQSKLRDVVSVLDFGATGDGSTDDTSAIQAAITALQTAGGGELFFPVPTSYYKHTGLTISGAASIILRGASWGSVLKVSGNSPSITIGNTSSDQTARVVIQDLLLDVVSTGTSAQHGIDMRRMHSSELRGVRIKNHGGDGIKLTGCYASSVYDCYSNNNTGNGLYLTALAGAGNDFIIVRDGKFLANSAKGIFVDNTGRASSGIKIIHNDIEGNAIGLQMDVGSAGNSDACTVSQNYFENQTGLNASIGAEGGTSFFRNFRFSDNTVNPGTVSAAANAVAFDQIMDAEVALNQFSTVNVTTTSDSVIESWYGNRGSGSFPTGFANAIPSFKQFRIRDSNGSDVATVQMDSTLVKVNYAFRSAASLIAHGATAIPAGGTAGAGLLVSSTANFGVFFGSGAPTLSAAKGSLYLRSDGSATNNRAYINTDGSTAWASVTTSS